MQKLFRKAERLEADDAQLTEVVQTACAMLTQHAQIEEELFYPRLREAGETDLVEEAQVEHDVAKQLIAQLEQARGGGEHYKAMFKVLGEYVNHHVEEEEGEIFRKAKRAKIDMAELGAEITMAKEAGGAEGPTGGAGRKSARRAGGATQAGDTGEQGGGRGARKRGGSSRGRAGAGGTSGAGSSAGIENTDVTGDTGTDAGLRSARGGRGKESIEDEDLMTGGEDEDIERSGGRSSPGRTEH